MVLAYHMFYAIPSRVLNRL